MSAPVRGTQPRIVRDAIIQSIAQGEIAPGAILSIATLASRFQVSATPVREALNQLLGTGLVVEDARGGFSVRKLDADELNAFLALRCQLMLTAQRDAPPSEEAVMAADAPLDAIMAGVAGVAQRRCWDWLMLNLCPYRRFEAALDPPAWPVEGLKANASRDWIRDYHRRCTAVSAHWIRTSNISQI